MNRGTEQEYYSICVDERAVRLYREDGVTPAQGRLLWTQRDYDAAVELALQLAGTKKLEFIDYVNNSDG